MISRVIFRNISPICRSLCAKVIYVMYNIGSMVITRKHELYIASTVTVVVVHVVDNIYIKCCFSYNIGLSH